MMSRHSGKGWGLLVAALVVAGCAALGLELYRKKSSVPVLKRPEVVQPVRTLTLNAAGDTSLRHYYGQVQGAQRVNLSFRVPGTLHELPLERGAKAKKGDLVARLDPRDFRTRLSEAQSRLSQAQAQYTQAANNYKRYEQLYRQKVIPEAQFDQFSTALQVARSAVQTAQSAVNAARDALKDTELRAPFSGIIVDRYVENFQDVQAKQTVVSLQDLKAVELVFNVPDKDLATVRGNNPTDVPMWAVFDAIPGRKFDVAFKEVSVQADPRTQTYPITVTMPSPTDVHILPGMPVTVTVDIPFNVPDEGKKKGFFVPASAVLGETDGRAYLWKFEDSIARKVPVKLGIYKGNRVEVFGALKNEDVIITAGVHYLKDGQRVRLMDAY